MKKLISVLLLGAMMLSLLASCGFEIPQMTAPDPDAYPEGEAKAQNVDYTTQTAWNGTASDTAWYSDSATSFTLYDGADLKGFIDLVYTKGKTFEGKTVKLYRDINLGNQAWSIPSGSGCFKGTFDGNGKTIGGFKMTNVNADNQSLLGVIGGAATVKNLTVLNGSITIKPNSQDPARTGIAGVISRVKCESGKSVTIENVDANCTIKQAGDTKTVTRVGGIIGVIEGSGSSIKISNCDFSGAITCYQNHIGGIVGGITGSTPTTLENCTNSAHIIGRDQLGGILGSATYLDANLTFNNCDNLGTVEVYYEYAGGNVGGIVGRVIGGPDETTTRNLTMSVTFTDCDNKGTVGILGSANFKYQTEIGGGNWTGGIAGYIYGGTKSSTYRYIKTVSFTNCHSTGNVKAGRTSGGLVGYVQRTQQLTLTNCSVDADLQFVINDHTYSASTPTNMQNRYAGGLLGAVETKAATYSGGAAVILNNCSVNGTLHVFEPYHFNSKTGGLVGMVRRSRIQLTNCAVNTEFSVEHLERTADDVDLDEVNLVLAGFQNSGTYYNGTSNQSVSYTWYNDIPNVEGYATPNNEIAYFKPVGHQYRYNEATDTYDLRYVFGVNKLLDTDKAIGFEVIAKALGDQVESRNIRVYCPSVYSSIQGGDEIYTASDKNCAYLCTLVIANIPASEITKTETGAYLTNTILTLSPFAGSSSDNTTENLEKTSSVNVVSHTREPQRYTFKQEAFTPYLPTVFAEKATAVTAPSAQVTGDDRYETYTSFALEVDEAGYYDFCFRIKLDGTKDTEQIRYALVQFDDEDYHTQTELYTKVTVKDGIMRDDGTNCNSYVVGYGKYLTAGSHTVTFRQPYDSLDGTDKSASLNVNGIYFYKDAKDPVDADIPLPDGAILYDGNFANNVTYALDGVDESLFTDYVNLLKSQGFSQKEQRTTTFQYSDFDVTNTPEYTVDGATKKANYTYTGNYVDDRNYYNYYYILTNADYMINVYFCSATGDMRIIVSDAEEYEKYDAVNDEAPAYDTVTTPLFAQLDIGGRDYKATSGSSITGVTNGLCYVYRLSDGRFMVIDGGFWNDKDTNGDEMARLLQWMQQHADYDHDGNYKNNKVTIAAWLITHHHSDHINGAYKFGMMYKDNELVEIQNYLYNFPSFEYAESMYGTDLAIGGAYLTYYPKMYTMLGNYNSQIVHSGMKYAFADATVEILSTHEDFYPDILKIYNNSSTIFKITLAGKTYLIAGDLQEEGQIKAIKRCGTLLESDFLQVTHHGCNGQLEFFKYIVGYSSPGVFNTDTVIVWPLPKGEDETWYEGTSARAFAMRWLRENFNSATNDTTHFAIENWVYSYATDIIPSFTNEDFSATKPTILNGSNVIKVAGSNCETGVTHKNATSTTSIYLFTLGNVTGASAHGTRKLIASESASKNIFHYYIDLGSSKPGGVSIDTLTTENCYIRFSFTVTQAGTYEIYSYMRQKNDTRTGIVQIDDQRPMEISYTVTADTDVIDAEAGSYMHWDGIQVKLAAGTHTITYKLGECTKTSMHFRDLYFVRVGN